MKTIIIGTAGHVDHGKSSLLKALAGNAVDRLPEEKRRGITLELGFPVMKAEGTRVFFVDVPGHETLVRGMIAGVCGFGSALFAVDACEGIMPQTREHAFILQTCGVKNIIAAVTKCDKAVESAAEKAAAETQDFFSGMGFSVRVLKTSVYDEKSMERLRKAVLETEAPLIQSGPFRMNIDRIFTVKGSGTVATGSVLSGEIRENDEIFIWPLNKTVRIKRIESAGERTGKALAGARAALNLAGVSVKDIKRGALACAPGAYEPVSSFRTEIRCPAGKENVLKDNKIYNVFIGTGKNRGRLLLKSGRIILERPFPAAEGEVFFIRGGSPETTLAGGRLYKLEKREKITVKKRDEKEKPDLKTSVHAEKAEQFIKAAGKPVTEKTLAQALNLPEAEIKTALKYLANRGKIAALEKAFVANDLFRSHTEAVKKIIAEKGFADIASAREATGLSRERCAALLDKGDRLSLWKNKNGTRY